MPVSDSEVAPERHAIARQREAVGTRQPDHRHAIGRRQRFDEPGRGHQRVFALEPADVRFIHRDHDDSAGVGAFVGAEMCRRPEDGQRTLSLRDRCTRCNKLCRDELPGAAVDLQAEVLGLRGADRPPVRVVHGGIDGDEVDARAEGRPALRGTSGRRRRPPIATIPAAMRMSLDIGAPKGHFRPYREVTNRGFLGLSCSEPGTNCIEPLPFGGCLDTASQALCEYWPASVWLRFSTWPEPPRHAQTGTAALVGDVTDSQKQVIPGAIVTLTHVGHDGLAEYHHRRARRVPLRQRAAGHLHAQGRASRIQDRDRRTGQPAGRLGDGARRSSSKSAASTETVSVVSETTHLNTTDASVGNVMSREQIRSLPVEAQNVVHLLSLQPGAIFIPTSNPATVDPRYGSVAGARADQQSVTLDGIDVNDPQMATAYTSAIRMTQEALQEFRVSTSNYNAEMGRSSGPQVSLVTRSGTNQFDGSGYWTFRRTATSTNEYFLELSQKAAGQESKAPKLDKDIFGGSFGGPIQRNRLFFFANVEQLKEQSEAPVVRNVPSNSMRDGVLMYQCATAAACPGGTVRGVTDNHTVPAGWYGMTPAEIAAIDPLGIGPSQAALAYFRQFPSPNDPGRDGRNLMDYRFAAPIENDFFNLVSRVDYKAADNHSFFARVGKQDDTINTAPQFEDARSAPPAAVQQLGRRDRLRRGAVADADQQLPLRLHEDRREQRRRDQQQLRHVPLHLAVRRQSARRSPTRGRRRRRTSSTTCRGSRAVTR